MSKATLLAEVWPGTFVEEGSLARNISDLRKALSAGGRERRSIVIPPESAFPASESAKAELPKLPMATVSLPQPTGASAAKDIASTLYPYVGTALPRPPPRLPARPFIGVDHGT